MQSDAVKFLCSIIVQKSGLEFLIVMKRQFGKFFLEMLSSGVYMIRSAQK